MPNPILRGGVKPPETLVRPQGRVTTPTSITGGTIPGVRGSIPVGGTVSPTDTGITPAAIPFGVTDPNTLPKPLSASAGNLAARLQIPDLQNPPLQPPVTVPQRNQPQITLPDVYRQNPNGAPSIYPPLTIRNGITMPSASPGVKPQTFPGMNWTDFLTVAHNAYTR